MVEISDRFEIAAFVLLAISQISCGNIIRPSSEKQKNEFFGTPNITFEDDTGLPDYLKLNYQNIIFILNSVLRFTKLYCYIFRFLHSVFGIFFIKE